MSLGLKESAQRDRDHGHTDNGITATRLSFAVACNSDGGQSGSFALDACGHVFVRRTCQPVKGALPTIANTGRPRDQILYGEIVNMAAKVVSAWTARQQGSFHSVLRLDRTAMRIPLKSENPPRELIFVTSAFVDDREYFYGESAAYECQHGYTSAALASSGTTLTSASTARGVYMLAPEVVRFRRWRRRVPGAPGECKQELLRVGHKVGVLVTAQSANVSRRTPMQPPPLSNVLVVTLFSG